MKKRSLTLIIIDLFYTIDVNHTSSTQALNQHVINDLARMVFDEEILIKGGLYKPTSLIRLVNANAEAINDWEFRPVCNKNQKHNFYKYSF